MVVMIGTVVDVFILHCEIDFMINNSLNSTGSCFCEGSFTFPTAALSLTKSSSQLAIFFTFDHDNFSLDLNAQQNSSVELHAWRGQSAAGDKLPREGQPLRSCPSPLTPSEGPLEVPPKLYFFAVNGGGRETQPPASVSLA